MINKYHQFLNKIPHKLSDLKIKSICEMYGIKRYKINPDSSIDVNDSVHLIGKRLSRLPLTFNRVDGNFSCERNSLTTLKGSPNYVSGFFDCGENNLTKLDFSTKSIGSGFFCNNNHLITLSGCPENINRLFYMNNNNLKDLKGFPEFYEGEVRLAGNPVNRILSPIRHDSVCRFINLLNEYDVIRNGEIIIRNRLEEAYYGIGMELPEDIKIEGYEII